VPRATQAIDYGRRGTGSSFGAFQPATGAALTAAYAGRTLANRVDCLVQVEAWLPAEAPRGYAVLDHLSTHRARDGLRFSLAFPRWAFGFPPTYAACLNLIEPWWKTLRSLALKGKRFATWGEIETAVQEAPRYWNTQNHPFVWGRRRRHRQVRAAGLALTPNVA